MKETVTYETHVQEGILLNANENTAGFSDALREEITEAVRNLAFNRYPDSGQSELRQAYAKVIGVSSDMVLAGNGSDQMLGFLIGSFLSEGKKLYTLQPDFSMYDYYASSYEAEVVKFRTEEDGTFDIDAFIAEGKKNGVSMVMFSNPNNPSGHLLKEAEIRKILEAFSDIPVIVDEAYIEFSSVPSSISLLGEYGNLYVTRTLSKAYGLAGIRTGFLISSPDNMKKLIPAFVPYALNSVSMKIACIVLSHHDEIMKMRDLTVSERNRVYNKIRECRKVHFYPSEANFIYGKSDEKAKLLAILKEENVVIRDYAGSAFLRITIGTQEENDLVMKAIGKFEETV